MHYKLSFLALLFAVITCKSYSQELYADNVNFNKRISVVDSFMILENMEADELMIPEMDLDENWSTDKVNPYKVDISKLPESLNIDVSNFAIPVVKNTKVNSEFGYRRRFRRFHYGTDLQIKKGDTIVAAFDGKVRIRKYDRGGYGYYLVVRHNNGLETIYGHLARFIAQVGDVVKAGEPIGLGGSTGRSTGPHLHFETRFLGKAFDPTEIFDFVKRDIYKDTYVFHVKDSGSKSTTVNGKIMASSTGHQDNILYHKIQSGDTLEKIAKRNGTTIAKLCKLNGLSKTTTLRIGKVLRCS